MDQGLLGERVIHLARILRPDHRLTQEDNECFVLRNVHYENVVYHLQPIVALLFSLYDGLRSDEEIEEIAKYLFGAKKESEFNRFMDNFFLSYQRFLIPVEKAENFFPKPWPSYAPKDYAIKQNSMIKDSKRLPAPQYLVLYLTNNCIRKCPYCYAKAKQKETIEENSMDTEKVMRIIHEAFKLGIEGILLTGGEPLLRPDIYKIIDCAASYHISVGLSTKGRINTDILQTIDFSLLNLSLSIDSHIPDVANALAGSPTFYRDMLDNITNLKRINVPYSVTTVITKLNQGHIRDTIQYFIDQGARNILLEHNVCSDKENKLFVYEEEKITIDNYINELNNIPEFRGKLTHSAYDKGVVNVTKLKCSTGRSRLSIRYDGKYIFCEKLANADDIELGNIFDKSVLDVWNSEELLAYINPERDSYKETVCFDCVDFDHCTGKNSCISQSKNQHGTYFRPIKEAEYACAQR